MDESIQMPIIIHPHLMKATLSYTHGKNQPFDMARKSIGLRIELMNDDRFTSCSMTQTTLLLIFINAKMQFTYRS